MKIKLISSRKVLHCYSWRIEFLLKECSLRRRAPGFELIKSDLDFAMSENHDSSELRKVFFETNLISLAGGYMQTIVTSVQIGLLKHIGTIIIL